ncbi:MAG TPA: S8 family serine peptidase [Gaiellaceae bacterium]|nr:S8 family serine peptidase [Gaiellaceae bacterium]
MTKTLLCLLAATLCGPASAFGANWAVGARPGGMAELRAELPSATTLVPGRALLVHGARPRVDGAAYVVDVDRTRRSLQFDNTEPDASQQWYLTQDDAWTYWATMPNLAPVKVAVIDSGIDAGHPEFAGRIAAGVSFVGGSWRTDSCGHGTFVAGEIAANPENGFGIAGLAFNAQLLVAKVVQSDCNVSTLGEIHAITWAVNHGARVINLSIGGIRDPNDLQLDSFSPPEEAAVEYAWSKDVLVVAAAGNGPQAPRTPWDYADYPAALPHVLGVAAVRQGGAVPDYSNRDRQFVDIAAPGGPILSTIPRDLVNDSKPGCAGSPFSNCGPSEFKDGIGTSFAAPQVSAAAALVLGVDPTLAASQVEWLLERSATDANPSTGCAICPAGRDSLTGWGTLDVDAALKLLGDEHNLPVRDELEPNDDADTIGASADRLPSLPRTIFATLDYWDDPIDVYSIHLDQGSELFVRLGRASAPGITVLLWKPGTTDVTGAVRTLLSQLAGRSTDVAGQQRLGYTAPATGRYFIEVKVGSPARAPERYQLSLAVKPG